VLFMTNIGTTWSAVGSLLDCLVDIATDLEQRLRDYSPEERAIHDAAVARLTQELPPLPNFSNFHRAFRPHEDSPAGDMRKAYFLAYDEDKYEYTKMDGSIERAIQSGREFVSCAFIAPYPPGFPVLVPGQVVSQEILTFLKKLDIKEIHGYRPELGLRVFTQEALDRVCAEGATGRGEGASAPGAHTAGRDATAARV
jgi:arginine decarboxylase